MKNQKTATRAKGFTLVELLLVITIIAVLAAMAFGMSKGARIKAKLAGSVSKVRDLGVGVMTYTQDNAGQLPVWKNDSDNLYWWGYLVTDPKNKSQLETFKSPGDKYFDVDKIEATISYGWNAKVVGRSESGEGDDGPKRLASFRDPSRVLVLADGSRNGFGLLEENKLPDAERYDGKVAGLMLDGTGKEMSIHEDFKEESIWFRTEEEREARNE
jgi:prepilin-type N-terminal cleavage/methylation domain-containing protein